MHKSACFFYKNDEMDIVGQHINGLYTLNEINIYSKTCRDVGVGGNKLYTFPDFLD